MEMPLPGLRAPQLHPLDNPLFVPSAELFDAKRQLLGASGFVRLMRENDKLE